MQFTVDQLREPVAVLHPEWSGDPEFSEHSDRRFAADGPRHELILFQNVGDEHAEWAFIEADGGVPPPNG